MPSTCSSSSASILKGLPFLVSTPSMTREEALEILRSELQKSRDSVRSDDDYVSLEDIKQEFGSH